MNWQRQVFFIGGFDPKSPRHYHRIYRKAATSRPSSAQGERVEVDARETLSPWRDEWTVRWHSPKAEAHPEIGTETSAQASSEAVCSRYSVLRWDDIVRRHWQRNLVQALRDYWSVYLTGRRHGILGQVWATARPAFWLAVFPLLVSSSLLAFCAALGWQIGWPWAWLALPLWLGLWRGLESRLNSEWLLRLYGFTHAQFHQRLPELEERLDQFAQDIVRSAEQTSARELLVVAHSTGSIMAVSVLARALALAPWLGQRGPALSLLTLGHCTPIMAYAHPATRFRAELARLHAHPHLTWIDFASRADWAAFSQVPPWISTEPAPAPALRLCASPRFHASLSQTSYARLRRDREALHMHYLNAPERASLYDPVLFTAGPLLLREHHAQLLAASSTPDMPDTP